MKDLDGKTNSPAGTTPEPKGSLKILLVEDNVYDAKLLQEYCTLAGFTGKFEWVTDGEQALGRLRDARENPPDLVILDIALPRVSGPEFLKAVRKDTQYARLPVIVLTSSKLESDVLRCVELGAECFVTKPNTIPDLEALIQRLIVVEFPRLVKRVR